MYWYLEVCVIIYINVHMIIDFLLIAAVLLIWLVTCNLYRLELLHFNLIALNCLKDNNWISLLVQRKAITVRYLKEIL